MHLPAHQEWHHFGKFYWDDTLELLFQESKNEIIRCLQEGVKTFEINRQTHLLTLRRSSSNSSPSVYRYAI